MTKIEGKTHTTLLNKYRKSAFTLAEVLITLGIIGVVAAMTMPALIGNYQKKEVVTRLKKAYSIVQQAIRLSELDNEEVQYWETNLSGDEFFNRYFEKYFQYTNRYTSQELWDVAPRKNLNGGDYGGTTYGIRDNRSFHIMLIDGTLITLNPGSTGCIWVGIDTNGLSKPNQIGKDTFLFIFSSEYGLQPLGGKGTTALDSGNWSYGEYDRDKITGTSSLACNKKSNGYWCAALIMNDGWEMAKDYPW